MPRDPNNPRWGYQPQPLMPRFMARVNKTETCWLWTGNISRQTGYGTFSVRNTGISSAHRASWLLFRGEIPAGHDIDHLCRVRHCVNPNHLEPVTHLENVRRGMLARGPMCERGIHDLTVPGARRADNMGCRACHLQRARERRAKRRAQREVRPGESFLMFINLR